jgi:tetratricopeptide (TPR) repeat protein
MFRQLSAAAILLAAVYASPVLAAGESGGADCSGLNDPDTFVVADPDSAIKDCTLIIQSAGTPRERAIAAINRAIAYMAKANFGKSDDASADRAAAAADFDEAVRLDPNFGFAYYARGAGAYLTPRRRETAADFDEAIRLDPNFAPAYFGRARIYAFKGDDQPAEADYGAAIKLDPNLSRAYMGRGALRMRTGDADGAIADLTEAMRLSAGVRDVVERNIFLRALGVRGGVLFAKGEFDRAVADFSDILRLDPKDAAAFEQRGIVELMGGSLDQARADLAEATELAPTRAGAAIWREIADRRAHVQGRLAEAAEKLPKSIWPATAVRAFLGEPTTRTMLAEASAAPDSFPVLKMWQICEATIYAGELALLKDAKAEAAEAFASAAKACPKAAPQQGVVAAELKGLGAGP